MNEIPEGSFGISALSLIIPAGLLLVWIALAGVAIWRAVKLTTGAATPLWILLVFLVPYVGAITTILCVYPRPARKFAPAPPAPTG